MNILMISGIFPPDIGGPATYVPLMAQALAERGHQVKVLTTTEPEKLATKHLYPFPVIRMNRRIPLKKRFFSYASEIIRQSRSVDIIYANGILLETALINKFLGKPLVIKIVGDEAWERSSRRGWTRDSFENFQNTPQRWPVPILKNIRSWYIKQADRIIVPSQYLKRFVVNWGFPDEKCTVIYNAVGRKEMSELEPAGEKEAEAQSSNLFRLITVGRLIALRNVNLILEAIARLPNTSLTIVGDGPCRGEWEEMAVRLNVGNRVTFAGALPVADVHTLLRKHDLFVLASSHEGLPHSVLEAMQCGLPVLTTRVGGTPELVQDNVNGLLVPSDDATALWEALRKMVADEKLRQRLVDGGRETIRCRFAPDHMVARTEETLLEIARSRKPGLPDTLRL
ncbi:MAG: glycosyltransferase family 4 protein [Armatimonadetes bacterium]|nr:glycosyltransferase family 4 protein [Armatimonadota bacterium]